MLSLGMDIGTSTVKLVLLRDGAMAKQWMAVHHGNPFVCLKKGLSTLELAMDTPFSLCVTGSNTEALLEQDSAIPSLGDIPAIVEGVRWIIPQVGSGRAIHHGLAEPRTSVFSQRTLRGRYRFVL